MTRARIRRARPLLGTFVEIDIEHDGAACAQAAIERAFGEVAQIHRLMSFHESGSDLDRLHRARAGARVRVDARTFEVLRCAQRIANASAGRFDPTVAVQLVASGLLPRPASRWSPDDAASWNDIELLDNGAVRLLRPLWLDLGGIAKGYAVDRALAILRDAGAVQSCVNAGGDLRVAGDRAEFVHLRLPDGIGARPGIELADAALATSAGAIPPPGERAPALHLDGRTRQPMGPRRVVSVVAPECMIADALTKVVMAADDALTRRVLAGFGAQAFVHAADRGWFVHGVAA